MRPIVELSSSRRVLTAAVPGQLTVSLRPLLVDRGNTLPTGLQLNRPDRKRDLSQVDGWSGAKTRWAGSCGWSRRSSRLLNAPRGFHAIYTNGQEVCASHCWLARLALCPRAVTRLELRTAPRLAG
jgi:hypothetical protein